MRRFLKDLRNEKGLTLVELLAVIVILAIVGAIAFVAIGNVIENSKKDAHVANALQVISAAKLYEAGGGEISSGGTQIKSLDTIEDLVDPWERGDDDYAAKEGDVVSKDNDGEFSINFSSTKCNIANKSELELREEGREACD